MLDAAAAQYAKQYGVDVAQARTVLEAQSHGAGLEEALRGALGDGFAGLEFDQARATWKVLLAPSGDQAQAVATMAKQGISDPIVEQARSSARARERAQRSLYDRLRSAVEADQVRIVADPEHGVVVETYPDTPQSTIDQAASAVGGAGDVASVQASKTKSTPEATCGIQYCDPPLVAGVRYWNSWNGGCTVAFSATATGGGSFNLTAGHCTSVPNWPYPTYTDYTCYSSGTPCPAVGWELGTYWNTGGDAGLIQMTNGSFPNYPGFRVYGWAYQTYAVLGTENAAIGMYVCHTGSYSVATTCGTVDSLTAPAGGVGGSAMIGVNGACAIHGDSGGPLFDPANGRAVGMLSGSYNPDSCVPTESTYEPVTRAAATFGVTVNHL